MGRQKLLSLLQREWEALIGSFAGLADRSLLQPGVVGRWSLRDLLCHITTWEDEFIKVLPLILEGKPLPRYGGIGAFNAREQERKRSLPLEQVKQQFTSTHQHLLGLLASLPETGSTLEKRLRRRLRLDTYSHYREHAAQILAWRKAALP